MTVLDLISTCSVILPLTGALASYRKQQEQTLKVLTLFFIVSTFADTYALTTVIMRINNLGGLHIYTVIECVFFLFYYYLLVTPRRKIFIVLIIAFIATGIYYSAFVISLSEYPLFTRTLEGLLLTGCALYYFYYLLANDDYVSLKSYPHFYINCGVLLYFMGNMFLFMLDHLFSTEMARRFNYFQVHSVINPTANVLYCVGFLCSLRKKR
jgi:hypothetical protein